ncbi:MAG: hypothetical protein FWD33_03215 [Alphaproteobacteria bacterium]|nr:hypothetical protein [Alphaproteobacteria bacterium]
MTYKSIKDFLSAINEQNAKVQEGIDFHKLAEKGELPPGIFDKTPELREFFGPNSQAEVPIAGFINGTVQSRRIDRVAVFDDEVRFLDFKTGSDLGDYDQQMSEYGKLLSEVYTNKKVTGWIYWVEKSALQQAYPKL